MKKVISFVFAALAALFMAVSVGVISADELPFNDLVTEISVVDDTNEIIEKNNNGGFVTTEVGGDYTVNDLVTSTEEPKTPAVPEEPTTPIVPEVEQPEKPSTPVVEEPSTPVETPSTPVETPELPIAELVVPPVEEPTKPSTPVEEKPVDDTPVIEKPVDPAPVIEKPELPVKPTPAPVVEKPEVPAEPTPTPAVEVPELPVTAEPTPEPVPTPVRSEQKMVELPYTGTQESIVSLVLAAFLLLMAGYIKKEFA